MSTVAYASFNVEIAQKIGVSSKPRSASDFYRFASILHQWSEQVENEWDTLSDSEKARHKGMVYRAIETKPNIYKKLRFQWRILNAPEDAAVQYASAVWRFINSVLDKVEEDNNQYRSDMMAAIDELNESDDMFVTKENAIERLREISS